MEFVLGEEEMNEIKTKKFYQLNINYMMLVSYMGPGQVGALGRWEP